MPKVSLDHEQRRREQILNAALACFARQGYHATSIGEIVRESGLSVGAIYSYFPSKEDLFLSVATRRTEQTLAQVRALFEQPGRMVDKTAAAADLFFAQLRDDAGSYARVSVDFWNEARNSQLLREQRLKLCEAVRQFMLELFAEAKRRGELRPEVDLSAAVELLLALNDGILLHHASGVQPVPLHVLKQAYVSFVVGALVPDEAGTDTGKSTIRPAMRSRARRARSGTLNSPTSIAP